MGQVNIRNVGQVNILATLRQTAREGPATGLSKIERTYPQLARVANLYHRQFCIDDGSAQEL